MPPLGECDPEPRVERDYPLVIGYHRAPLTWTVHGWREPVSPNGILPTLCSLFTAAEKDSAALLGGNRSVWVAAVVREPEHDIGFEDHPAMPLSLLPMHPVEWREYFHLACKETVWPVLMSQPHRLRFDPESWVRYRAVNARFADEIAARAAPNAAVWLHDYNLWLVPGILRQQRPDLRIGLFHHTPFPEPEIFAELPPASEIRAALGCLDWAGFHTEVYARNFRRLLAGMPRQPRIGIQPLEIDRAAIATLARSRPLPHLMNRHVVLSVERLDYAKAPVQKVEAIAELLALHPDLCNRLVFRLVCPPPENGVNAYETTRISLEHRIAEINAAWRDDDWKPIDYQPRRLSFPEVIDHYLAADVFWVTSLQDGMNLTAKEFIAAKTACDRSGVLVLSRYVGAAAQLGAAALLTDPRSPADLSATLYRALTLTGEQRREHMSRLGELLGDRHPADWANAIISAIRDEV